MILFIYLFIFCAGPVCEEKLLPAGVANTQLPADTAVQAAVAQGGGRQPQIHHVIMSFLPQIFRHVFSIYPHPIIVLFRVTALSY